MQSDHSSNISRKFFTSLHYIFMTNNSLLKFPNSYASSAVNFLAVKISSFAFISPINRGKRCVPPAPGIIAQLVSVRPTLRLLDCNRKVTRQHQFKTASKCISIYSCNRGLWKICDTIKNISNCFYISPNFLFMLKFFVLLNLLLH